MIPLERISGTVEVAATIEAAEVDFLDCCTKAMEDRGVPRVLRTELAGGFAAWTGDTSPLNKIAGLGFRGVPSIAALETIEGEFAARETPVQVELSSLADSSIATRLGERGYRYVGSENVLARRLNQHQPSTQRFIEVRPSEADELDLWLDVMVTGFASPDDRGVPSTESFPREALERTMRDLAATEGFRRSLAWSDGTAVGGGALRIARSGVAQLCGAATLPEHRRQGVQRALLAARLTEAVEAGCTLAVVTTQPGSTSQQNVERHDFQLVYVRTVLVRSVLVRSQNGQ